MATERIIIEVSERGSRTVRRNLEDIGNSATRAEGGVQLLRRALGLIGGGLAVRELVQMADTYTNLQNRLKLVTSGTANLARVTDELFEISNRTRSSFEGTANMYARVALSARSLGVSQQELLNFTESLNQAVILSGASMREAEGALIQLSQGLASGTLQGDELRSVLEQLPMVADVIAEHLGVTRGELREMGKEGQITAQMILEAFREARGELADQFAQTVPTIGQALQVLKNRAMELWGEFTTGSGIAQALAASIMWVANNLENIIPLALTVAAIFAAWTVGSSIMAVLGPLLALERALGATTTASALFGVAMKGAQRAVMGLTAAIAANPIGAIAVAITAVIALLYTFSDDIKVTEDGVVSLRDVFVAAFQIIMESLQGVIAFFQTGWETAVGVVNTIFAAFGTTVSEVFQAILQVAKVIVNGLIGVFVLAFRTIQLAWNNFPGFMDALFTGVVNAAISAANTVLNAWQAPLRLIQAGLEATGADGLASRLQGALDTVTIRIPPRRASAAGQQFARDFGNAAQEALTTDYVGNFADAVMARARQNAEARGQQGELDPAGPGRVVPSTQDAASSTRDLADAERDAQNALADFLREIDQEIALLGMSRREREKMQMIYRLEDQMKRQLTQTERELVDARIAELQAARDREAIGRAIQDLEEENELLTLNRREREMRVEVMRLERDLGRELTEAERAQIEALVLQNQALREQRDILNEINGPMEDIRARQQALNDLFANGRITLEEYEREMRKLGVAATELDNTLEGGVANALARLAQEADNFSAQISDAIVGMTKKLEDSIVEFVKTGKFSFKDLADFAIEQFVRIMTQQLIAQIAGSILPGFGLPGFANGGSFIVGGSGTTDSKLVAFRATPGERVDVSTPNQQRSGRNGDGGNNYNISVTVQDPRDEMSARRTGKAVAREVGRAIQRVSGDLPRR